MKRTCIFLIPTISGDVEFDDATKLVESLLGRLNIDTCEEGLAFSTTINLSEEQKETFVNRLEELGLKTIFIEVDEGLLDKISSKNTINLTKCKYEE